MPDRAPSFRYEDNSEGFMRLPALIATCALLCTTLTLYAQQAPAPGVPVPVPAKPPAKTASTPAPEAPAAEPKDEQPEAKATAPATPTTGKPGKAPEKPKGPPARDLFGAAKTPAPLAARAIGFYAKGCLAGGKPLPVDGPAWQAMRLSRTRNWGHPELVDLVKRLATEAKQQDGWSGLLVGDLAQPRGGPMTSGHASHQVGLDADIWLTPMPDRRLSEREREDMSATSMLKSYEAVDPNIWSEKHAKLIKRAASYTEVERIFVHPAIKKALCEGTPKDADRAWLSKVRPMYGHNYHFHIRIHCPKGSTNCEAQPAVGHEDGCGTELTKWLALVKPKPPVPVPPGPRPPPPPGKPPMSIDELPNDCRSVLASGPDGIAVPEASKAAAKPHKTAASKTTSKK
jgi:penicillin-insensitive murein endopeptidase